jgi:hypothetical protein
VKGAFDAPPAIRLLLVWAHTCDLDDLFRAVGAKADGMNRLFRDMTWRSQADTFFESPTIGITAYTRVGSIGLCF